MRMFAVVLIVLGMLFAMQRPASSQEYATHESFETAAPLQEAGALRWQQD